MRLLLRSLLGHRESGPGNWLSLVPQLRERISISKAEILSSLLRRMSSNSVAPRIVATPTRMLIDEQFRLEVQHLPPHRPVTLHSRLLSEQQIIWEAFAQYISGPDGAVKVDQDESCGGSYTGREPMGLIWSMKPLDNKGGMRLLKKDVTTPYVVHISVYDGHITDGFCEEEALATAELERSYLAPGMKRIEVRENRIVGALFLPPGRGPFPAVLDIWGGGSPLESRAALLACHGFASLSLSYIFHSDLPGPWGSVNVGLDYFEEAFNFLKNHPQVAGDRIAIVGLSFGATLVLLMATEIPNINPKCLVCVSGAHVFPHKSLQGDVFRNLQSKVDKLRYADNGSVIWRNIILPIPEDPEEKVKLGKIRCPMLLICGDDDQNWATVEAADDMEKMMRAAGNSHLLTWVSYPGTGHIIEPPYHPHIRESPFMIPSLQQKVMLLFGGETKLHTSAQEDSWKRILGFLEQHLILDGKHMRSQL